jgi:hypothetical protein
MVYLNGFLEGSSYVASLSNVIHIGEVKSSDGYSIIQCYETID